MGSSCSSYYCCALFRVSFWSIYMCGDYLWHTGLGTLRMVGQHPQVLLQNEFLTNCCCLETPKFVIRTKW